MSECRNCGGSALEELGPIGRLAPFFLKRVLGLELRYARSMNPVKERVRRAWQLAMGLPFLDRLGVQFAYAEMQLCSRCSFIQTKRPFRDDDIMRLYRDYRSESYNRERIQYEPSYRSIAHAVGHDQVEIQNRKGALIKFLRRNLPSLENLTMLDYGGSDGRFLPDLPGSKFVFEVSDIVPIDGVTRINSETELGKYPIVFLAHVIEHVPHPLDLVQKVANYVEPGGFLYIEVPQEISDDAREGLRQGTRRFDVGIHEHINSYCVTAVRHLLRSAGLDTMDIESLSVDVGWAKRMGWGEGIHIMALGRKGVGLQESKFSQGSRFSQIRTA